MKLRFLIILISAVVCTQVFSEDYSWVETDELKLELKARRDDVKRTHRRIEDLNQQLLAQQNEKQNLYHKLEMVESRLVQRTSMLYRLSKNGKSVQYLFGSDSMTAFVKRMQTLRLLVTSQMDEKREYTLQMTRIENEIERTRQQITSAKELITQLKATVQNLQQELSRRPDAGIFR